MLNLGVIAILATAFTVIMKEGNYLKDSLRRVSCSGNWVDTLP